MRDTGQHSNSPDTDVKKGCPHCGQPFFVGSGCDFAVNRAAARCFVLIYGGKNHSVFYHKGIFLLGADDISACVLPTNELFAFFIFCRYGYFIALFIRSATRSAVYGNSVLDIFVICGCGYSICRHIKGKACFSCIKTAYSLNRPTRKFLSDCRLVCGDSHACALNKHTFACSAYYGKIV